ncbi:MAG: beta-ketoacyl-[acyl-carrier-protein] synthase family protein [Chthoniobacterales bacterium]
MSSTGCAKRRVLVTGMGIVSPLGVGAEENLNSLRQAKDAVSEVTSFDVSRTRCKTAGQIPDDWFDGVVKFSRKTKRLHRSSHMMIAALREALATAEMARPELLVVATSSGGMSNGERFYRQLLASTPRRSFPELVANYMPQKPVLDALQATQIRAPVQIISNACSAGSNAIGHAFELIKAGMHECVLGGGYDPLGELVFVGFDALQAATPEKIRPFDRNRSGLVLGEGAAILVLESEDSAARRGISALAEVIGYGVSTDTYHMTQPNPSGIGPRLAMERAMRSAKTEAASISYINAHGTATIFNDATEGRAISALFRHVPVSSTKSMMGHALGAAGAIEAGFCVLALRHQFLPPNINFREPDPDSEFEIVANRPLSAKVERALSNSFGFGGTNASLVFQRV